MAWQYVRTNGSLYTDSMEKGVPFFMTLARKIAFSAYWLYSRYTL